MWFAGSLALRPYTCERSNHPKKSVQQQRVAEVQGAVVDGVEGVAVPKREKVLKYVQLALMLISKGKSNLKQAQVVGGGLVYLAMFRRPLLGSLNGIWNFILELGKVPPVVELPLPPLVVLELTRFASLVPLCVMDFRMSLAEVVTASDASTTGGGVTASKGLTEYGKAAALSSVRGDVLGEESHVQVLSIGLFDGIGALRTALDALQVSCIGHISVETSPAASRVVEANFPGSLLCGDVTKIGKEEVQQWACKYSQASLIIIGAGPPCQGVSGLNSERKGALRDERSRLFKEVPRIKRLVQAAFPWAMVHQLMESVQSMDEKDRCTMSESVGLQPWGIEAAGVSLARRPRLYWITWELLVGEGVVLHPPPSSSYSDYGEVDLVAIVDPAIYLTKGWKKVGNESFPTFTTSRPRSSPGPRPAGLKQCTLKEKSLWEEDHFRFPPYQYREVFHVENSDGQRRLVNVEEREAIMGFPIGYTAACVPKSQSKGSEVNDTRLSLIGNSWNVTVIVWLLGQLLAPLGISPRVSPQEAVNCTSPGRGKALQTLLRRPKHVGHRYQLPCASDQAALELNRKLTGLVSIKGEDILLASSSEAQTKHHRLRSSVPARLWKWRTICGWKWTGSPEHINCLELRAVLTTVKWRLKKLRECRSKFIHLVDSQVVLHALSRGRSSSRKLRRTLLRINSLLLATGSSGVWAYMSIHHKTQPTGLAGTPPRRNG